MKTTIPQLKELKDHSKPAEDFEKVLWAELSDSYDRKYPSMVFCLRHRFTVPVVVLCLFVMTGVGSYAYASPSVTQEHVLFPVKDGMEWMQEVVTRSPSGRAGFHTRMMERRIEEGEYLINHNTVSLPHIERIDASFAQALSALEGTDQEDEAREEMLNRLRTGRVRYEFILTESIEHERETPRPEELRNVLLDLRVHIDESGLSDDEKRALRGHENGQEFIAE